MKKIFFLLFIMGSFCASPAFAYIDPGTGSMLFSVVLCSITTVTFLFSTLLLKLKSKLFAEKSLSKTKHKYVIYSEGNQYFSVFKPILDEFEKREIYVMYYTSSDTDPVFKENYSYIKSEYIGKGNKAYFKLAFINADICLMTTPQLDVLQLKRSRDVKHYCHILHSIGFCVDYRLFSLDYYDSVLCDAKFQIPLIREIEKKRNLPTKQLPVVGSTYMDYNQSRLNQFANQHSNYTILIAPSWGKFSLLNKYGDLLLSQLKNTDFNIIIRPHPQTIINEKALIDKLKNKYQDKNITWDYNPDNLESLSKADILISDFSCVMMDYAFLFNRPFLYFDTQIDWNAYDCGDLDELPPWRYKVMNKIGRKIDINNDKIENIVDIINEVKNNKDLLQNIEDAKNYAWEEQKNAANNVVNFLVQKQLEVSSK